MKHQFLGMSIDEIQRHVNGEVISEVLEQLDHTDDELESSAPLMESGLDSLAATQLVRALGKKLGLQLPPTLLFDFPTIDQLSDHLVSLLGHADSGATSRSLSTRGPVLRMTPGGTAPEERQIAIVGMSCRLPGGIEGPGMLWDVVTAGRSVVGKVPLSRWDAAAVAAADSSLDEDVRQRMGYGGFVDDLELFDACLLYTSPSPRDH